MGGVINFCKGNKERKTTTHRHYYFASCLVIKNEHPRLLSKSIDGQSPTGNVRY